MKTLLDSPKYKKLSSKREEFLRSSGCTCSKELFNEIDRLRKSANKLELDWQHSTECKTPKEALKKLNDAEDMSAAIKAIEALNQLGVRFTLKLRKKKKPVYTAMFSGTRSYSRSMSTAILEAAIATKKKL